MITRASGALPDQTVGWTPRRSRHATNLRGASSWPALAAALLAPFFLTDGDAQRPPSTAAHERAVVAVGGAADNPSFRWSRTLRPGSTLEVKGVVGNIRAVQANDSQARIVARRGAADEGRNVDFRVLEDGEKVTICAVYPGTDAGECTPGREISRPVHRGSPSVDFMIEVPSGVHLLVATRTGDIAVENVDGDVEAYGVVGLIRVSTSGAAQAETVTGDIHATLGHTDWSGARSFRTVTGNVVLELPPEPSTTVSALAALGEISSVFPLTEPRLPRDGVYRYPYRAEGVLGAGGRDLVLEVARGSIFITHPRHSGNRPLADGLPPRPDRGHSTVSPQAVRMSLPAARTLLRHRDPETRGRAVVALQNHGGREASDLLRPVLASDPDRGVRQRAAFSLGQIGQIEAVEELRAALATDSDARVRQAAAYSLGVLADQASEPTLLRAVDDPDPRVSQTAIWALGELNR
jgi:hypothetical protein